ncbi:hypothetical protein [Flavobacterium hercynium]|uniref:Uncharacterized protein n=1 Tax=Flavobacterium hercynium TaxID=387094 RepID=A0A226HI16_9FLAO|nr:hypothetical protein [Flavobacterium hercynium]OXA93802.1 hypothetical protein B0A66_06020 [Flavobacterium hercynium]SMP20348.1 hypothetical protein SAMN06265346_106163 [Flavobacterium hercynium]
MKFDFSEIANLNGVTNVYNDTIPDALLKSALADLKLPDDSEINYLWKKKGKAEALVITPAFIALVNENKQVSRFDFDEISRAYFSPDSFFYLYDLKGDRCATIPSRFFGLESKNDLTAIHREIIKDFFNDRISSGHFAYDVDKCLDIAINEITGLYDFTKVAQLEESQKHEYATKIISIYDNFIATHGDEIIYYALEYYLVLALSLKNESTEALKIADNIINDSDEDTDLEFWYSIKAHIHDDLNQLYSAIIYAKKALKLSKTTESKLEHKKQISELSERFNAEFLEMHISERKVILISDELKETPPDTFIVLDKNSLPKGLLFENSYAKSNELYVAHPFIKGSYLSFSNFEAGLSADRFDEFFYFVQCLGAKKITYRIVKENSSGRNKNSTLVADLSLGLGKGPVKNTGSAAMENETRSSGQAETLNSRSKTQLFNPVKAPYIPWDLIWYPNELTWHRLYQQRVSGNILQHHEVISLKNSLALSASEKNNIKLAFKNFFTDASVNINQLVEENFNQNESVEWEIEIEFESVENLTENHISPNAEQQVSIISDDAEKEYMDELKHMLEDGNEISDRERSFLERFREKKGILKDRADQLEKSMMATRNLSNNEKEYLEEYQELLAEGEITEKERRILNRFAARLGIENERAQELENSIKK